MDYGIFLTPGINWTLVWLSFLFAGVFLASVIVLAVFDFSSFSANDKDVLQIILTIVFIVTFIAIWPLLAVGLARPNLTTDCMDQKYATEGIYEVVNESLKLDRDYLRNNKYSDYYKPEEFLLTLEGKSYKGEDSMPMIVRCVKVEYRDMSHNYLYAPPEPQKDPEWKSEVPRYALKHAGDVWELTDVLPQNLKKRRKE